MDTPLYLGTAFSELPVLEGLRAANGSRPCPAGEANGWEPGAECDVPSSVRVYNPLSSYLLAAHCILISHKAQLTPIT